MAIKESFIDSSTLRENVVSFNKSDMSNMMNDVSEGMRQYTYSKSTGNIKKDFLDFIEDKDRRK